MIYVGIGLALVLVLVITLVAYPSSGKGAQRYQMRRRTKAQQDESAARSYMRADYFREQRQAMIRLDPLTPEDVWEDPLGEIAQELMDAEQADRVASRG